MLFNLYKTELNTFRPCTLCPCTLNTLKVEELKEGVMCISDKVLFDVDCLKYLAQMHYRAFTSFRAAADVHSVVYDVPYEDFRRHLSFGVIMYLAVSEMPLIDRHTSVYLTRRSATGRLASDQVGCKVDALQ